MNYYEHHIGDYLKGTAHLSMLEDAAYRRLLDAYYTREAPLPAERKACYKLARAQAKDERAAVDYVLDEFFSLDGDGWHQSRCDEEIARYQEKMPKAQEKRENAKARQQRARERRAAMFEELRAGGVHLPWDATADELQRQVERVRASSRHAPVTRDDTATQTPDTRHQYTTQAAYTPLTEGASATVSVAAALPSDSDSVDPIHIRAVELTVLLHKRGAALQASNPTVRSWAEKGVTDAQALTALDVANERRAASGSAQPVNAGYLDSIIRDQLNPPKPKAPPWWGSVASMDAKARELGISTARPGEELDAYKARITAAIRVAEGAAA